ncbi:MAG: hypothetical protein IT422_22700 [Pirellulaceae bacterium]|nr:hypothetical protein [Pirellulaceae bacterium]
MKTPDFTNTIYTAVRHLTNQAVIVCITAVLASLAQAKDIQAERVYNWDFQRDNDANFDQKPDDWKRRLDREHPAYIDMRITSRVPDKAQIALEAQGTLAIWMRTCETRRWQGNYVAESPPPELAKLLDRTLLDNCLEISMDGGAAELVSPMFPMQNRYSYALQAEVSCQELDGHTAWVELQLLDDSEQVLQVLRTNAIEGTVDWQTLATQIASSPSSDLRYGRVHIKVEPHSSTVLKGIARFDSLRVYRMPRLSLSTQLPFYVAQPGEEFQVNCMAMGIREHNSRVRFELCNHVGELIRDETIELNISEPPASESIAESRLSHAYSPAAQRAEIDAKPPYYVSAHVGRRAVDGHANWNLKLDEPGLYRVKVNLGREGVHAQLREILIGVMSPQPVQPAGPFGWSLSEFGQRLSVEEVPEMVRRFGAGWIKMPVWFDPNDTVTADRLVALIERLQGLGTEVVGVLGQPPQSLKESFGDSSDHLYAVNIFRDPADWEPALEPVLTRIGMKIAWFQIGNDHDNSFVNKPKLAETIANIRTRMQSFSQELKLALTWTWNDPAPEATAVPWTAIQFANSPQLTAAELENYVSHQASGSELWVTLDPLEAAKYPLVERVRDLTERMVATKRSQVTAAFVVDPLRPELQLFTKRKTIGEMLIPWHSLVSSIGAAAYAGSIEFPGGSTNHFFTRHRESGDETLALLWNDVPTDEQIDLGGQLQARDVWGKSIPLRTVQTERGTSEQQIRVGPWPIFVHGVDLNIVRFHQQFELQLKNMDNALSVAQTIPVSIANTLPQNAIGKVTVVSSSLLNGERSESPLQLSSGVQQFKSLPVFIRNDASAGSHRLRFDFDLVANKPYNFSIYRTLVLGMGDIELIWDTTRREDDWLELRVEIRNNTEDSATFDCKLFPAGRPYQRFRLDESKPGNTVQEMRIRLNQVERGSEAWLRCEQIGSGRVLNYRIQL